MKRIICSLIVLCCLLVLAGCEKTTGEETLSPANETTQPARGTTVPPETTDLPETTVPEETTPELETREIGYLLMMDQIPAVDPETTGMVIHIPQSDFGSLVVVTHIRFPTALSYGLPYEDGVFWKCMEEQEYKSGSHFQCYALDDGQLITLENKTLSKTLYVDNNQIPVDMQYAIYRDQVIVTYRPNPSFITILDDSRGAENCIVKLECWNLETGSDYFACLALMDMETGTLKASYANKDSNFIAVDKEGKVVMQRQEDGQYWLLDLSNGTVVEDYTYEPQEYALIFSGAYVDGKNYLEVTDPLNGETFLLKVPEGWDFHEISWWRSPDGRKLMVWDKDLLIYDADRNMWVEIRRTLPEGMAEDIYYWTKDSQVVIASADRKHVSVYCFDP